MWSVRCDIGEKWFASLFLSLNKTLREIKKHVSAKPFNRFGRPIMPIASVKVSIVPIVGRLSDTASAVPPLNLSTTGVYSTAKALIAQYDNPN